MYVRMGDLKIVPCHRQSYDGYNMGHFKLNKEENKIVGIQAENLEMGITMLTFDLGTQPYCEKCVLKEICSGGCIGAQLEYNGDPFIPIPTVCDLEFHRHYTLYNKLKEMGIWESMKQYINNEVLKVYENLEKMMTEEVK